MSDMKTEIYHDTDDQERLRLARNGEWLINVGPKSVSALREFFQAERDKELGRWRDPEAPERIVIPGHKDGWVQVWNETTLEREGTYTWDSAEDHCDDPDLPCAETARRYFAAHPEPKPWHDPAPGTVWDIEMDNYLAIFVVRADKKDDETRFIVIAGSKEMDLGTVVSPTSHNITAARRIWPPVEVSDGE